MSGKIYVGISEYPLDIKKAYDFVDDPSHGAVNSFVGVVRKSNLGREVVAVSYDVFEPLADKVLQQLCEKVRDSYGGKINIYLEHFRGKLDVGGISVVITVSTPHRAESFDSCRTLIEELKHLAPIWKLEYYLDGDSGWVKGHALCQHAEEKKEQKVCCSHV